ncbi:hypothetical protein HMPREF0080_00909 [Anaeroglobus geminatus F0357]|uniref:Uncharacterized protein n=1 Tax=Anaeroglobus geminatus F0357 TaxID=861450 RepID=G9YGY9_9FIRM|nr:hypothetical protein HMPREF0080_00909 [Anaeroglobus geminatus F0357]
MPAADFTDLSEAYAKWSGERRRYSLMFKERSCSDRFFFILLPCRLGKSF